MIRWLVTLSGGAALLWAAVSPIAGALPAASPPHPGGSLALVRRYPADSLLSVSFKRNMFRSERRPAGVAYDPARQVESVPAAPAPPKPSLALVGLVGGPPGSAVIEGLPGVEGWRVVRKGDVVGDLSVRAIGRDSVVIVGMDTVWVLRVKEPWKN